MEFLHHASFSISVLGVLVIVFGVLGGLVRFLRAEFAAACGTDVELERRNMRQGLGYYLLLGLEFLIAADVIDTLMKPEPRELIALGAIVAIRTVISHSLNSELTHATAVPARAGEGSRPPVLLVRRTNASALYFLLVDRNGDPVNKRVLGLVAEPVRITGDVERQGDLLILRADPAMYRRVPRVGD